MHVNHVWSLDALNAIRELAEERKTFTSDDLYAKVPEAPHYNMIGDAFREARRLGIIEMTGQSIRSTRKLSKGRRVQVWRKAGSEALHVEPQGVLSV